jgi:hypothetical protein
MWDESRGSIAVGVDDGGGSTNAVRFAAMEAQRQGVELVTTGGDPAAPAGIGSGGGDPTRWGPSGPSLGGAGGCRQRVPQQAGRGRGGRRESAGPLFTNPGEAGFAATIRPWITQVGLGSRRVQRVTQAGSPGSAAV